ncbi:MAG: hypothetical protein R2862_08225 [Thermoanaerobaculia bacterium]
MSTLAPPKIVVADASVLINFANLDRFDLLCKLPGYDFVVPNEVKAEITRPAQAARFAAALGARALRIEPSTDLAEIALAVAIRRDLDAGEAACLAMAEHRGWRIACDERGRYLNLALQRVGASRMLDTAGLIVRAIHSNLLTIPKADALLVQLAQHKFVMPFRSFQELLK